MVKFKKTFNMNWADCFSSFDVLPWTSLSEIYLIISSQDTVEERLHDTVWQLL